MDWYLMEFWSVYLIWMQEDNGVCIKLSKWWRFLRSKSLVIDC
jgi:hypothetical protein